MRICKTNMVFQNLLPDQRANSDIDFVTYKLRALSKGLLLVVCMTTKCA